MLRFGDMLAGTIGVLVGILHCWSLPLAQQ
jgi:hypothetical protein